MNTRIVERSILHYTNKERRKRNIHALRSNRALIRAAREHTRSLARRNRGLSHKGERYLARKYGYHSDYVGANLWRSSGRQGLAWKSRFLWRSDWQLGRAAVISWMNSPGHRRWMLSLGHQDIGVGVRRNRHGKIYMALMCGDPHWGKVIVRSQTSWKWLWWAIGLALLFVMAGICNRVF